MAAKRLHFFGIAGHAMRGVALAAKQAGNEVTGTDPGAKPPGSTWLDDHGITWYSEAGAEHLEGVDLVVMSGGTLADDPELMAAQEQNIPIQSYAEFVGGLLADRKRIVVAGTHGKTTTTSFITWLLETGELHPDFVIGIQPGNFDSSVRLDKSSVAVLEGDEYKASTIDERSKFMYYRPDVLVATSLEMDHPDLFKNIDEIKTRFKELAKGMSEDGYILHWVGSGLLADVMKTSKAMIESYGDDGDWYADHVDFNETGISLDLYYKGAYKGHFRVPLYGRHNVLNIVAGLAIGIRENIDIHLLEKACENFLGASRRFTIMSRPGAKIRIVDDYAHHPTEIATTIEAAKLHFGGRVIALVQPHTYSRTSELLNEYRSSIANANVGFVAEIEGAREAHLAHTVSGEDIARDNTDHVFYVADRAEMAERIIAEAKPGDTIICMTVGGYQNIVTELVEKLS